MNSINELQKLRRVLDSTDVGIWELVASEDSPLQLFCDRKMQELMGLPEDHGMSPEQIAEYHGQRIHPDDVPIFMEYHNKLVRGERDEITYRWIHPTLGIRYVRCGGGQSESDNGNVINGYHYDVTTQVEKEQRNNMVIRSLARHYVFINYINLHEDSFITYTSSEDVPETIISMLMIGTASQAIRYVLDELIAEEHIEEMTHFTDLSTVNQRLAHKHIIKHQFKSYRQEWFEWTFAPADRNADGTIRNLLWSVQKIDDEKQVALRQQKEIEDRKAANVAMNRFFHNMSHEIRTPLNALYGFAQLLGTSGDSLTDEDRRECLDQIESSYHMLDTLLSDILDLAAADDQGDFHLTFSDFEINSLLKSCIMSVEHRCPAGVRLHQTSDFPDGVTFKSDVTRIQQVLINFLTNACKNTTRGEIHLHATRHENRLIFDVTDTGRGIPASKATQIFERFTKLDKYVQGTGLGLNICKTIAHRLGGDLYLDLHHHPGARFVFELECTDDTLRQPEITPPQ